MADMKWDIEVGYTVNQDNLKKLEASLKALTHNASEASLGGKMDQELLKASESAKKVQKALKDCYNTDLGSLNVAKFNQKLKESGTSLKQISTDFAKAGAAGANSFNLLNSAMLRTNIQLKQADGMLDNFARTFANTVKYNISGGIYREVVGSINQAISYTRHLDTSLNDIRIVTDKSADSMQRFAKEANIAAKALGASTLDYTEASLIFYQQGLDDAETKARTEATLKAANVTGQSGAEVSEQLTAVWNGYKVSAEETELYVDKLAAVAASTAADLEELSTGMSKVASAANAMGVDVDQLNAQLATIVSVTRQAPESVGTALKTIYARMSTIEAGGEEEGTNLKNYTETMAKFGISVLDGQNKLRDMGSVMEEVGNKWATMSREQQVALAQAMAGTRQYNNLLALFENWDMYGEALKTSAEAVGTLQHQQDIYLQSTEAHIQKVRTAAQGLYDVLIDNKEVNTVFDTMANGVEALTNVLDSFGGGMSSLVGIGTILAGLFSTQISNAFVSVSTKIQDAVNNLTAFQNRQETLQNAIQQHGAAKGASAAGYAADASSLLTDNTALELGKDSMTDAQFQSLNKMIQERADIESEIARIRYNNVELLEKEGVSQQFIQGLYTDKITYLDEELTLLQAFDKLEAQLTEQQEAQKNLVKGTTQEEEDLLRIEKEIVELQNTKGLQNKKNLIANKYKDAANIMQSAGYDTDAVNKVRSGSKKALEEQTANAKVLTAEYEKQYQIHESNISVIKGEKAQLDATITAQEEINNLKQQSANLQQKIYDATAKAYQNTVSIRTVTIGVTSTLSTMATLYSSISGIVSTLKNDQLSVGEKISQIIMTTSFALPMMVSNLSKMGELIQSQNTRLELQKSLHTFIESAQGVENAEQALATLESQRQYLLLVQEKTLKGEILTQEELINAGLDDESATLDIINAKLAENARLRGVAATEANAGAGLGNNIGTLVGNGVNKVGAAAKSFGTTAKNFGAGILKTKSLSGAFSAIGVESAATAAALGVVTAAAASAAVIIGGAAVTAHIFSKNMKELSATLNSHADSLQKSRDTTKEELDNLQALQEAYHELDAANATDEASKKELQNATYQLCLQYGEEALAIKSLTASYEELDAIMTNLSGDKLEEIQSSAIREQGLRKQGLTTQLDAIWSPFDSLGQGIVNTDLNMSSGEKAYAQAIAESIGLDSNAFMDGNGASMNVYDYIDDIAAHQEEFFKTMESMSNGGDFEKELKKIFTDDFKATVIAYGNAIDDANEATKQIAVNSFDNTVTDYKEFNERFDTALKDLTNNSFNGDSAEARKYLLSELAKSNFNDDISSYIQTESIATQLIGADAAPEELEKLSNEIYSWTKEQREFVAQNAGLFLGMDPDEISEALETTYKDSIEKLSDLNSAAKIKAILELVDENDNVFTQATIDKIFEDKSIHLNVDKETFEGMDDLGRTLALRQSLLADMQSASTADMQAQRDNATENISKYSGSTGAGAWAEDIAGIQFYTQTLADFDEVENKFNLDNIEERIKSAKEVITDNGYSVEDLKEKYESLGDIDLDYLDTIIYQSDNWMGYDSEELADFCEQMNVTEEQAADLARSMKQLVAIDIWTEQKEAAEKYNKYMESMAIQLADANEKLFNPEYLKQNKELLSDVSKSLDGVQSAYKSMTNIVKDYNDNQHLTLDNLQALLAMEPEYLACLEMDGDKMAINEDALRALTQSRLDEAKTLIYEQSALRIQAVVEGQNTQATAEYNLVKLQEAEINGTLTGTILTLAEAENVYAQAIENAKNLTAEQAASVAEIQRETEMMIKNIDSINLNDFKSTFGSSGGSSKKDKELKKLEDEFDRYWDLNKAIDAVELSLSRLDKLQSNLHGKELIRSLQKENKLLAEQKSRYEDLYAEQLKEAGELQGKLANFGVAFGADGAISNYAQATQNALAQFNEAVNAYNAGTLSDEAYEAAEKTYQAFKDALERYDTLYYNEMKKTQDKLIDLWKEELANNLEAWTTEIQIQLDLSEAERQWNDFLHDIGENFKAEYEDISFDMKNYLDDALTYAGAQGTVSTRINAISDVEREIDKLMGGQDSDMFESVSQAQEKLKELRDQLEDDALAVHNLWKKAWDDYLKSIDQGEKKLDDLMNKFKQIDNELEFQGQLIELIYGDKAFNLMDKLYNAQSKNSLAQVDSVRQQRDMWKKMYDEAEEGNADRAKYYDLWIEAQNNLNDLVVEHIELLKNDYLNTVNSIIDTVKKNTVGGDLDFAKTQWSDRKSMEEGFYDDTERVYQIETMQNKWEEVISNAPLNQQKKLTELMNQQLENLKNKTRLSEYDIGLAERELQIAQARLDLENAQNNKNSMKVTRGTDGNWSYQYVVDDEDVANKQQALLDAINDKYEYIKQKNQEVLESLLENTEKYWERYYEILADTTLKDEEREARLAELWETYYGEEGLLTVAYAQSEQTKQDLNQATFELLDEAYVQNVESYSEMTAAQQALIDGLKDGTIASYEDIQAACQTINDESLTSWQTMARDMADAWNADDGQSIKSQVLAAMDECQRALDEYGLAIDYLAAVADMDFSEAGISGSINQAEQATEQLTLSTGILIDEIQSDLANALGVVNELEQSWYGVRDAILEAIGALSEYLSLVGQEKEFNFDNPAKTVSALLDSLQAGAGNGAGSAGKTGDKNKYTYHKDEVGMYTVYDSDNKVVDGYKHVSLEKAQEKANEITTWNTSTVYSQNVQYGVDDYGSKTGKKMVYSNYDKAVEAAKLIWKDEWEKHIVKMATGGYTGEWGSEGRMAMLHEKELVLNAADTKNILSVVDTVRDLSGLGTSISSVIADGIANTLAKLAGIRSGSVATPAPGIASAAGNTFNITAEFPNANDVNEIREAILSLPNLASQYVNQKLK